MNNVKLYIYNINNLIIDFKDIPFIDNKDIVYAMKYKQIIDQKQQIISRYFKNKYIKNWYINENKKPLSNDIYFNISHSHDYVILAISNKYNIGIDIELKNDKREDRLKNFICNKEELDFIKENDDFYKIWTSKESLLKCVGTGLVNDLKKVNSLPIDGMKEYDGKIYYSHYINYDNYSLSITIMSDEDFDIEIVEERI